jgi:GAF domain-containing protein
MQMGRTRALLAKARQVSTPEFFQAVCLDTSGDLDIDQSSVWTFDPHGQKIECQCRYDALTKEFSRHQALRQQDCPRYFRAIVEENYVCAPDVATHPATREFLESYFKPNGIVSLLDFIMHEDAVPYGIICCENRRGIRQWSEADRNYLRSIATLTSFLFLPAARA